MSSKLDSCQNQIANKVLRMKIKKGQTNNNLGDKKPRELVKNVCFYSSSEQMNPVVLLSVLARFRSGKQRSLGKNNNSDAEEDGERRGSWNGSSSIERRRLFPVDLSWGYAAEGRSAV